MKKISFLILILIPSLVFSQDLTGIWRGHFRSNNSSLLEKMYGVVDRYKFEVQLDQSDKAFNGVTYSYKTTVFYGKANCKGTVNASTSKVMLEELKIVEVRMTEGSDACIMTLFLTYTRNGDEELMEGSYTSMNIRDSSSCGRGTVFLRKVATSDFYKEPFLVKKEEEALKKKSAPPVVKKSTEIKTTPKVDKPVVAKTNPPATKKPEVKKPATTTAKTNPAVKKPSTTTTNKKKTETGTTTKDIANTNPSKTIIIPPRTDTIKQVERRVNPNVPTPKVLANRQNELVKTIVVNTTEVQVDLYDNGTIDNDTVSVYLDKKLVVSKRRLTDQPISVKLKLDEGNDYHELVMVAENLGEIPPNTSLMVVKAGDKQFEVRITSNEQKNAVVIFKYQKPG